MTDEQLTPAERDRGDWAQEQHDLSLAMLGALAGAASELDDIGHSVVRNSSKLLTTVRLVVALSLLAAAFGAYTAWSARDQVDKQNDVIEQLLQIAQQNKDNGEAVRDCTTPGGICYERNRGDTGAFVMQLQEYMLIVAQCGTQEEGPDAVRSCVERKVNDGSR